MSDELLASRTRVRVTRSPDGRRSAPVAPTGWAMKRGADLEVTGRSTCTCGSELNACLGCGQLRCLACDPYLSDDCRWSL